MITATLRMEREDPVRKVKEKGRRGDFPLSISQEKWKLYVMAARMREKEDQNNHFSCERKEGVTLSSVREGNRRRVVSYH